jgi:hypothetical protein
MKYKNAASASASFAPIKKKLLASAPLDGEGTAAQLPPKKGAKGKAKGGKKRGAEEAELDDEKGDGEDLSKVKVKGKKAKASEDEDEDGEVEVKGEASDVD